MWGLIVENASGRIFCFEMFNRADWTANTIVSLSYLKYSSEPAAEKL